MKNNKVVEIVNPLDEQRVRKVQEACLRAYRRLGSWRAVGEYFGVAHRYAWDLGMHGVVPSNKDIRKALGLPRVLPSERKPRVKRVDWRVGLVKGLERI